LVQRNFGTRDWEGRGIKMESEAGPKKNGGIREVQYGIKKGRRGMSQFSAKGWPIL